MAQGAIVSFADRAAEDICRNRATASGRRSPPDVVERVLV